MEKFFMENPLQKSTTRYSAEEKQQIIKQWKKSGLSRKEFCSEHNLNYHALHHWTRKIRKQKVKNNPEFIPIKIKTSEELPFAIIEFGSGKSIHLFQPVSSSFLKLLLR